MYLYFTQVILSVKTLYFDFTTFQSGNYDFSLRYIYISLLFHFLINAKINKSFKR